MDEEEAQKAEDLLNDIFGRISGGNPVTYYDRQGNPLTPGRFYRLKFEDLDHSYERVAGTQREDIFISTVWMGHDLGWGQTEYPLIFETMIFPECGYCERTSTEAAALAAHDQAVAFVESGEYAARYRDQESEASREG